MVISTSAGAGLFYGIKKHLAWVVLAAAAVLLFLYIFPTYRETRVNSGVIYHGVQVEGYTEEEVRKVVRHIAARKNRNPVDAEIDYEKETILPELNGIKVDIESTVSEILKAPPGEEVSSRLVEVVPRVSWEDHPALPAYKGNPVKERVSFMINVAWGEEYLEDMLQVLKEEEVRATFFITGRWAEEHPELLAELKRQGHELGSHGYSDREVMPELDWSGLEESLSRTNEIIYSTTGVKPEYFTPHRGEYNHLTLEMVARQSMRTVLWSLDSVDWKEPGVEHMENKIKERVTAGDIILMHPTEDTVELFSRIVPLLQEKSLRLSTIGEHLSPSPAPRAGDL